MNCPECNAWSFVKETRTNTRRRECANGHRFTTQEVLYEKRQPKQATGTLQSVMSAWWVAKDQCLRCAFVVVRTASEGERIMTCKRTGRHCIETRDHECQDGRLFVEASEKREKARPVQLWKAAHT